MVHIHQWTGSSLEQLMPCCLLGTSIIWTNAEIALLSSGPIGTSVKFESEYKTKLFQENSLFLEIVIVDHYLWNLSVDFIIDMSKFSMPNDLQSAIDSNNLQVQVIHEWLTLITKLIFLEKILDFTNLLYFASLLYFTICLSCSFLL